MSDPEFIGECLCGAVMFRVVGPTKWCAHCHCSMCRRAHGAAFVTWFGVPLDQFEVLTGAERLNWYGSSTDAERGFCDQCGSTILFRSTRWSDEMHIVLANIEGAIDREPAAHVFFETHVEWLKFDDGLMRLGGPTGTEPLDDGSP